MAGLVEVLQERLLKEEFEPGVVRLWQHFAAIAPIPRNSGSEDLIASHIEGIAKDRKIPYEVDQFGNILFEIPATNGCESSPGVVLQAHMDMVCLGNPDPAINGVDPKVDETGEWVTANTTLGADNGIGLASMLSIMNENISHGPLALMFTRTEETGLVGARNMSFRNRLDNYRYFVNLDSEEEGEATISSAGAGDTVISLPIKTEPIGNKKIVSIKLDNLMGGHSGVVIREQRLNATKVMTNIIQNLIKRMEMVNLISFDSGAKRNAIPKSAVAVLAIDPEKTDILEAAITEVRENILKQSVHEEEQAMELNVSDADSSADLMMTNASTLELLGLLSALPNGLIKWSEDIEGLPQTSTNLAIVNTSMNTATIQLMSRSSVFEELEAVRSDIQAVAKEFGANVEQSEAYSGWPADPNNPLVQVTAEEWKKLTGNKLQTVATHGGLECGVIIGKYPHLKAISIGPTIQKAHEEAERVNIASVSRFYSYLKGIVSSLASN